MSFYIDTTYIICHKCNTNYRMNIIPPRENVAGCNLSIPIKEFIKKSNGNIEVI